MTMDAVGSAPELPNGSTRLEGLAKACRDGDETEVRDILGQQGGAVVKWLRWGAGEQTPLMWAAREGHLGVVKLLLEGEEGKMLKERLNIKSSSGGTALLLACLYGHEDVACCLIEKGASAGTADNDGRDALMVASSRGHLAIVRRIIQEEPWLVGRVAESGPYVGRSALYEASAHDHPEVVKALILEGGADHWASADPCSWESAKTRGNWRILEVMQMIDDAREALPPNAVREAIEADDVYALAAHVSKVGVGLLVRSEEDGLPPFSQAAVDNRVKVLRWMLSLRHVPVVHDDLGAADALTEAAALGHVEAVSLFLERGWPLSMDMVADPLVTAATHGRVDVVRLILSKLSDAEKMVQMLPEEIDGIKSMALWCASYEGQQEVIEVLLALGGADHTKSWKLGTQEYGGAVPERFRPLEVAQYWENDESVAVLKAVAEARTAFQAAVRAGDVEVVKRMLEQQCHESESVIDVAASVREVQARAPASPVLKDGLRTSDGGGPDSRGARQGSGEERMDMGQAEQGEADRTSKPSTTTSLLINSRGGETRHTALMAAVIGGHLEMARSLLERGAVTDLQDEHGLTALHHAVSKRSEEMVVLLLTSGSSCTISDAQGCLPLHAATSCGTDGGGADIIRLLLGAGDMKRQLSHKNKRERTPLHEACWAGNVSALTALLEHCLLSQCDLHMDDELLLAAAKGSRNAADESGYGEVIRLLVAFERSQCAIDQALMQACRGSYLFDRRRAPNAACVRALLEAGANHALDYAEWRWDSGFSQCMPGTAALLSEVTGERNALVEAARTGDVETVARMLGMGQEPTLGETIIPWASRPQQMTRLVNGRETGGHFCTPMIAAVVEGQLEVMRLLYRAGADLELTNSEEKTATFIAAEHGQVEALDLLISWGAQISLVVDVTEQHNASVATSKNGHAGALTRLLEVCSDVDKKSMQKALEEAMERGHIECIQVILQWEPDILFAPYWEASLILSALLGSRAEILAECLACIPTQQGDWEIRQLRQARTRGDPRCVCIIERWEAEQAMLLSKARCIHDASLPSARRPPALQQRTTPLPTVAINALGTEAEAAGGRKRGRRRLKHDAEEVAAAAAFVVQDMRPDLFVELMDLWLGPMPASAE